MPMPAHMTLEGETQGPIAGPCDMPGREDSMLIQAFDHQVAIPRDPQTGQPTGKRVHHPFTITKVYDKASPLLYTALCTGERFSTVMLKWYRISPAGMEEHYFTHELHHAVIVSIRPWMPICIDPKTETFTHMEEVAFTYRHILWTFEDGGISAEDDWNVPK